jgi:sigma-E factor negative regulatory protein RseB
MRPRRQAWTVSPASTPTSCSLVPRDNLRFGYRIWSEKKTGLVVKLQTLDADGQVIEQAAFSELQLDAPVKMDKLAQMMASTEGYRVEKSRTGQDHGTQAEGWLLKQPGGRASGP